MRSLPYLENRYTSSLSASNKAKKLVLNDSTLYYFTALAFTDLNIPLRQTKNYSKLSKPQS